MAARAPRAASFPWKPLERELTVPAREHVARSTRALLAWQERLEHWPRIVRAPDATPFVSVYAGGRLVGCFGSTEGPPGERLVRAFARAVEDPRYGGIQAEERGALTASVSYLRAPARRSMADIERRFELGTEGVAAVLPGKTSALLLPRVAAEEHADLGCLLRILARKLGAAPGELERAALYTFEADTVVARPHGIHRVSSRLDCLDAAASWLAAQVDRAGAVGFAVDARERERHPQGEFMHGRAAVVIQALAAHGGHPRTVVRARRRLRTEIRAALGGGRVPHWPRGAAPVAGTVALAVLAGVDLVEELVELARSEDIEQNPWHGAQVVTALGARAPRSLWQACVTHLGEQPWAPWTALAASAVGDVCVAARTTDTLVASIRRDGPNTGAANVTRPPEVALTAIALEALVPMRSGKARAAIARGRSFLFSTQLMGDRIPAPLDPALSHGAFPLSPAADGLRSDVTAHALLALIGVRDQGAGSSSR